MKVYYNENDKSCVAWLRELMRAGAIPAGDIDDRSIVDVLPADLAGYDQCHFFAGIGGWAYALALADWPEDRPVWTGSCPCQPFSAAGQQRGTADERHLWPEFHRLIAECKPPTVFGEQVASKLGREWLAGVFADLESVGYAVAGADLCAASVGAPHIRQRLYWLAQSEIEKFNGRWNTGDGRRELADDSNLRGMADADGGHESDGGLQRGGQHGQQPEDDGAVGMADAMQSGWSERWTVAGNRQAPWSSFDILQCTDGKARRTGPQIFPLAHGLSGRMGRLRGAGNAIVPQVAAAFIKAAA